MKKYFKYSLVPIVLGLFIFSGTLIGILGMQQEESSAAPDVELNVSAEVLQWRSKVEAEAKKNDIPELVNILLAIIQQESGGNAASTPDIMQASESQGRPPNSIADPNESIEVGVAYFAQVVKSAKAQNCDVNTAILAYNMGGGAVSYIAKKGGKYSIEIAKSFSREVVAPSLGNLSGITYPYPNPIANDHGNFLYLNGGNFFYVELVLSCVKTLDTSTGVSTAKGWKAEVLKFALSDVGKSYPTGWGQRGECIVAVQNWINTIKGGTFIPGGVHSGYTQSGAREVAWNQVQAGDVIQYESLSIPEEFYGGVHTMLVESVNKDFTINVVESNVPAGSGLVGQRKNLTNASPAGFRAVVWRFPD